MNFLHAMGARVIGCSEQSKSIQGTTKGVFEEKPYFSDEEWQRVADGYNELAKIAAGKDMQVCLHHHMGTGIQTTAEIDRYMSMVNDDVYLLFDTGHAYYSEGSQQAMMAILEKYLPRINHVHLKDVRDEVVAEVKANKLSFLDGVKKGTFTVPGDGVIDFRPVFATGRARLQRVDGGGGRAGSGAGQSVRVCGKSAPLYSGNRRHLSGEG